MGTVPELDLLGPKMNEAIFSAKARQKPRRYAACRESNCRQGPRGAPLNAKLQQHQHVAPLRWGESLSESSWPRKKKQNESEQT